MQITVEALEGKFPINSFVLCHTSTCTQIGQILQTSDLFVTNLNLNEMLTDANYDRLETALREVYSGLEEAGPRVVTLIDPRDRNIEAPEPPERIG